MNIMFDVDGVLADFVLDFTKLSVELGLSNKIIRTVNNPSWNDFGGMSTYTQTATWDAVRKDKFFWYNLAPLVEYSVWHTIARLIADHNVYFYTHRSGIHPKLQTEEWLEYYGIKCPTVIIGKRKGEFAKSADVDFAIDDKAANASCIDWVTEGKTRSYLIDRPYNQVPAEFLGSGVKRVSSVKEFIDDIILEQERHNEKG